MRTFLPFACIAGLVFALAAPTHAASRIDVTSSFSNVQLTVRDLTPDDGMQAGYTMLPGSNIDLSTFSTLGDDPLTQVRDSDFQRIAFGAAGTSQLSSLGATVSAGTDTALGTLRTAASFPGPARGGDLLGSALQSVHFTLAAHSELVLTGDYALAVRRHGDDLGTQSGDAFAQAMFFTNRVESADFYSLIVAQNEPGGTYDRHFNIAYANNTDTATTVELFMSSSAATYGHEPIAGIPEPHTYAMMGAGLLMLVARRRGKRA